MSPTSREGRSWGPPLPHVLSPGLTQQRLQSAAALLEPVSWVSGGEEDGRWQPTCRGVQAEAHSSEQGLPARDATHFVLHALLGRVHGVALPVLDAL